MLGNSILQQNMVQNQEINHTIIDAEIVKLSSEIIALKTRLNHLEFLLTGLKNWRQIIAPEDTTLNFLVSQDHTAFTLTLTTPLQNNNQKTPGNIFKVIKRAMTNPVFKGVSDER